MSESNPAIVLPNNTAMASSTAESSTTESSDARLVKSGKRRRRRRKSTNSGSSASAPAAPPSEERPRSSPQVRTPAPAASRTAGLERRGAASVRSNAPSASGGANAARKRDANRGREQPPVAAKRLPQRSPEKIVAELGTPAPETAAAEPLTSEELESIRKGLRFLREHRKVLKLKLNAHEDLLVNGARPPDHRGVCAHLFAKVEYSRVQAVVEQLKPEQRAPFMEGVLQFTNDLSSILLYLEALRDGANRSAGSALSQALKRIDFQALSEGQLRRVLDLVVEVFGAESRTRVLLQLFNVSAFGEKLQAALAKFPPALVEAIAPLWEAHRSYLRPGAPLVSRLTPQLLEGLRATLELDSATLLSLHPKARERVLRAVLMPGGNAAEVPLQAAGLSTLIEHAAPELRAKFEELRLLRWVAEGAYTDAARRLEQLSAAGTLTDRLTRLKQALTEPRIGTVALSGPRKHGTLSRHLGTCLRTLLPLYIWRTEPGHHTVLQAALQSYASTLLPSVSRIHSSLLSESAPGFIAVACRGRSLTQRISERPALQTRLRWAIDGVLLLSALSAQGIALVGAHAERFEVDASDRLWLFDLVPDVARGPEVQASGVTDAGGESSAPDAGFSASLELASWLLRSNSNPAVPREWTIALAQAKNHQELISRLCEFELEVQAS